MKAVESKHKSLAAENLNLTYLKWTRYCNFQLDVIVLVSHQDYYIKYRKA